MKSKKIQELEAKVERMRTAAENARQAIHAMCDCDPVEKPMVSVASEALIRVCNQLGDAIAATPTDSAREIADLKRELEQLKKGGRHEG